VQLGITFKVLEMDETESEILYEVRNDEISSSFPENFKMRLLRAAEVMNERHLGKSAVFLIELANTLKQETKQEAQSYSLDPYRVEYSREEESRLTIANIHLGNDYNYNFR